MCGQGYNRTLFFDNRQVGEVISNIYRVYEIVIGVFYEYGTGDREVGDN